MIYNSRTQKLYELIYYARYTTDKYRMREIFPYKFYLFHYIYIVMRWTGHVERMGEGRGVYRVLVGKPEGKKPLGRPRRRWEEYIRMEIQEVGCGCVDWIGLAQDRDRWRALVSAVMNLRVP
jgi:hypothetical protein